MKRNGKNHSAIKGTIGMNLVDRTILINQLEILKRMEPENEEKYEMILELLVPEKIHRDGVIRLPEGMAHEGILWVLETLFLFIVMEEYRWKNPEDDEFWDHEYNHFLGFDLERETGYYRLARYLIEKQQHFKELNWYREATDGFNSHQPVLDKYKRMVIAWKKQGRLLTSHEEVMRVLEA